MATLQEMRSESRPYQTDVRWFHSETVTDTTSEPLVLPAVEGREVAAVSVMPGTSAKVQYTTSSYADIEADAAVWHDWPAGSVAAKTSDDVKTAISALRLVSVGASDWEVTV